MTKIREVKARDRVNIYEIMQQDGRIKSGAISPTFNFKYDQKDFGTIVEIASVYLRICDALIVFIVTSDNRIVLTQHISILKHILCDAWTECKYTVLCQRRYIVRKRHEK